DIDVERGGVGLVRVRDDGCGIASEELPMALARHATSKIAGVGDLEAITTLGFRGEALPSIGSVSRLRIVSRASGADQAAELIVDGGTVGPARPAAHPPGTSVEVRDLFFNVPARRKFVRSDATELGHIARLTERLALSRFDVSIRLRHGERVLLDAPASDLEGNELARLGQVLDPDFGASAIAVRHAAGPVMLSGWAGLPTRSRAQPDQQFWFVNGRSVRDRLLMNAVRLAYRDVLYHGRHAAYALYLTLDPRLVDVNAHPQKLEVRFRDSRQVHDFVFRALERALAATRPDPHVPAAARAGEAPGNGYAAGLAGGDSLAPADARAGAARASPGLGFSRDAILSRSRAPSRRGCSPPRAARRCRPRGTTPSAPRSRSCMAPTSSRRTRKGWCSSICMPRTSECCTRSSKPSASAAPPPRSSCWSLWSSSSRPTSSPRSSSVTPSGNGQGSSSMRCPPRGWRCGACRRR
ncbi:MAG: hypothetical protein E6K29_03355, partial [Gammaproteobacteria bacterium]